MVIDTEHPSDALARLRFKIEKGTYGLIFELQTSCRLMVGKLGRFGFPAGWYAYTGSARGPGGLRARVAHHLRLSRSPHWHMDYLRPHGTIHELWYGADNRHDEHRWAACLQSMPNALALVPGFGSSDCRCQTHLVYFTERPGIYRFRRHCHGYKGKTNSPIFRLEMERL